MRCNRARRISAWKASRGISVRDERLLADHLRACPECARLQDQLERTWRALEHIPSFEPSPDFVPKVKARIRAERDVPRSAPNWRPGVAWKWAALAAGVMLVAVLLTKNGPLRHEVIPPNHGVNVTDHDSWDEEFLQDLELTLQQSDADYLSTYDSWPGAAQGTSGLKPTENRPIDRTRKNKKEIS